MGGQGRQRTSERYNYSSIAVRGQTQTALDRLQRAYSEEKGVKVTKADTVHLAVTEALAKRKGSDERRSR